MKNIKSILNISKNIKSRCKTGKYNKIQNDCVYLFERV